MNKKFVLVCSAVIGLANISPVMCDVDMDVVIMIEQNEVESFKHKLEVGLDPNEGLADQSLLMIAAQVGNVAIVHELLAHEGINIQAADESGNTALHYAALYDHLSIVKAILYADVPVACACKNNPHPQWAHHKQNSSGKTAADLAHSPRIREMLANPDEYIKSNPQEFREIATWFEAACPAKAEARERRIETLGQRVNRNYKQAKSVIANAKDKTVNAVRRAYEKTRKPSAKSDSKGSNLKKKVASKYEKAKAFVNWHLTQVKETAADAIGFSKEHASAGYEKTKVAASNGLEKSKKVAASGFEKVKNAIKAAYHKVKGGK